MTAEVFFLDDPAGLISPVSGGITWLVDREVSSQLDVAAPEDLSILKDTGY